MHGRVYMYARGQLLSNTYWMQGLTSNRSRLWFQVLASKTQAHKKQVFPPVLLNSNSTLFFLLCEHFLYMSLYSFPLRPR